MNFELIIKDENGKVVCKNIAFAEDRLEEISKAAGGLEVFINDYYNK